MAIGAMTARTTGVIGAMIGVTGGMTVAIAVPDLGCCGDRSCVPGPRNRRPLPLWPRMRNSWIGDVMSRWLAAIGSLVQGY